MPLLFVYGSLKRGFSNCRELAAAVFVREATTGNGYRLHRVGSYPALVEGGEGTVRGELYQVSAALLARIDAFEGCPDEYQRVEIALDDGTRAEAYVMTASSVEGCPPIPLGIFLEA